ncbi:hypothetical protein BDV96DRAFT_648713 [Lophiotrema nucula]|uniref:Uncharacterized protein n=1 Tax=Lophiotrema nucula TaxID=690887 RepID=A0A6A5Z226_9PLEO|nr:hypothetical protein BDV96DRAFT_648713 [Lophiotrema nucula]
MKRNLADASLLGHLLVCAPKLTTLHYDFYLSDDEQRFELGSLKDALVGIKDTLQHLVIYFAPNSNRSPVVKAHSRLGSLKLFECLRSLEIAPEILFGTKQEGDTTDLRYLVPDALERLVFRGDFELPGYENYRWPSSEISRALEEWRDVAPNNTRVAKLDSRLD